MVKGREVEEEVGGGVQVFQVPRAVGQGRASKYEM